MIEGSFLCGHSVSSDGMSGESDPSSERTDDETATTREEVRTIAFRLREIQRLLSIRVTQENRRLAANELEPVAKENFPKQTDQRRSETDK